MILCTRNFYLLLGYVKLKNKMKNINWLNLVFTHNRLQTQKEFWRTLHENTAIKADKTIIFDDYSHPNVQEYLFELSRKYNYDLVLKNTPNGYARNYYEAFTMALTESPKIISFIESDYVFRRGFMEEVNALFEALPDCWVIKGFSHKDYYNRNKVIPWFKDVTTQTFGLPLKSADNLYIPKTAKTKYGDIEYMYGSHACGTIFVNWDRVVRSVEPELMHSIFYPMLLSACKNLEYGQVINDGLISSTYAKLWDLIVNKDGDKNDQSGVVFISDHSIANHLNSGGVNNDGYLDEGISTVTANFPENYNTFFRADKLADYF